MNDILGREFKEGQYVAFVRVQPGGTTAFLALGIVKNIKKKSVEVSRFDYELKQWDKKTIVRINNLKKAIIIDEETLDQLLLEAIGS